MTAQTGEFSSSPLVRQFSKNLVKKKEIREIFESSAGRDTADEYCDKYGINIEQFDNLVRSINRIRKEARETVFRGIKEKLIQFKNR